MYQLATSEVVNHKTAAPRHVGTKAKNALPTQRKYHKKITFKSYDTKKIYIKKKHMPPPLPFPPHPSPNSTSNHNKSKAMSIH
jgi:hypothetical protein